MPRHRLPGVRQCLLSLLPIGLHLRREWQLAAVQGVRPVLILLLLLLLLLLQPRHVQCVSMML